MSSDEVAASDGRSALGVDALVVGVLSRNRAVLARTITLLESDREEDRPLADRVLLALSPHAGRSIRIGVSGSPGVGKSTFIEALGLHVLSLGHRVAVLAIDPTSTETRGSILGDKTRMQKLASHADAFVRPSPTRGALGGVTRRTREAILACEAAGHDVIIVETVGTGQNEAGVADMTDVVVLLVLPGAGDELQGIKRGVLERADVVVVNKADGPRIEMAERAKVELESALRILRGRKATPAVFATSAVAGVGVSDVSDHILAVHRARADSGELEQLRRTQRVRWMWSTIEASLMAAFCASDAVDAIAAEVEARVRDGTCTPASGAERLLAAFFRRSRDDAT